MVEYQNQDQESLEQSDNEFSLVLGTPGETSSLVQHQFYDEKTKSYSKSNRRSLIQSFTGLC